LTGLSMAPLYHQEPIDTFKVCVGRNGYKNARWLLIGNNQGSSILNNIDVVNQEWYLADADKQSRRIGSIKAGSPGCLNTNNVVSKSGIWIRTAGPTGRTSSNVNFKISPRDRVTFGDLFESYGASLLSGSDSFSDSNFGGETQLLFGSAVDNNIITLREQKIDVSAWSLNLALQRGVDGVFKQPDKYTITYQLVTPDEVLDGQSEGEAIWSGAVWSLRGNNSLSSKSAPDEVFVGGFWMELDPNGPGPLDDQISWRVDGFEFQSQ
jgi:hypothetical protein